MTFHYTDKREYAVTAEAVGKGILQVHAYADKRIGRVEVKARVEVVDVGVYETPFTLELPAGTYTLNASYKEQKQTKTATVKSAETTRVDFEFAAPVAPILWILLFMSTAFGLALLTPTIKR